MLELGDGLDLLHRDPADLVLVGKRNPPTAQRVYWASLEGIVAAVLLLGSGVAGLTALQTAAISAGLPFAVLILLMIFSLHKALAAALTECRIDPV
jgi:choline-glycine betaine transporter